MHQCGVVVGVSILVLLDGNCDDDREEVIPTRGDGCVANPIEEDRGTNHTHDNTIFTVRM